MKIIPEWDAHNVKETSPNKTFCMAPWSHTYLSPQGERRMCCASRERHTFQKQYIDASNDERYGKVEDAKTSADDFNPLTLEEHWNSEYMKTIRRKLMAGETIPECDVCNENILSVSNYRRWFTGVLFRDQIEDAFAQTDDDGYTTMKPRSFDYRVSNLCNFKCRMCGEQLSSSWEAEKKKHGLWNEKDQPFMVPAVKQKMEKFQVEVAEAEFRKAVESGIVEEIYWVGGEPLMYDIHWEFLDIMVANGSSKNCYLRYNTNLSRVSYKGKNLFDYLPHFKNWLICASIDGTGELVEYIRSGIKWDVWLENFKEGVRCDKDKMRIDLTLTGPGMFSIKDLFDVSLELDVGMETKIMFAFHPDIVFSPFAWPKHILHEVIDDALAYCEPRATPKQATLIQTLHHMKSLETFQERWPDKWHSAFRGGNAYQDKISDIRGTKKLAEIYQQHKPELGEWWINTATSTE